MCMNLLNTKHVLVSAQENWFDMKKDLCCVQVTMDTSGHKSAELTPVLAETPSHVTQRKCYYENCFKCLTQQAGSKLLHNIK